MTNSIWWFEVEGGGGVVGNIWAWNRIYAAFFKCPNKVPEEEDEEEDVVEV